jgi:penicillin-binding protein 2
MVSHEPDPVDRTGRLVESHKGYDPRIVYLYFLIGGLLLLLAGALAKHQLFSSSRYFGQERQQNERRLVMPGPRGTIYDRNGIPLVTNRALFAVAIDLAQLQPEFRLEFIRIRTNYRNHGDGDLPTSDDMEQIARTTVVQRYLDRVNAILGRAARVDPTTLRVHFQRQRLFPFPLITDLEPNEFAELTEHLPVGSPLQIYASSARKYPYDSAASHVLGYVGVDPDVDAEDVDSEDLHTFKLKGFIGRDGLEKRFDNELQGKAGLEIFRVDPAGFKVSPPLEKRLPVQGKNLTTSLDIELQLVAEQALGDRQGSAVALDVRTGEVLVLASKPDYNLNAFSPRLLPATVADIEKRSAWTNLAIAGAFPPGSTFKTVVAMAGLRTGLLDPADTSVDCEGTIRIGNHTFKCDNGLGRHGALDLREAIGQSCDVYFWNHGVKIGVEAIAAEARRFHLDQPTGIELPNETRRMNVPDAAWKQKEGRGTWTDGDTANFSIGQGDLLVSPLEMACYAASLARGETATHPTLLHDPKRPAQHSEAIGLSSDQLAALFDGMERCTAPGKEHTGYLISTLPAYEVPGVRICGKTGTAQLSGRLDEAWFICFAPRENPEIAVAVAIQGDTPGEGYGGGMEAVPVAAKILQKYFANKAGAAVPQAALTAREAARVAAAP